MSNPVWVSKDTNGNINGVFANPQSFPVTQTTDADPAVVAFLNPPPPIPDITRRQFVQQMAAQGIIAQSDAIALVSNGTMPPSLSTVIAKLPTAEQFAANMFILSGEDFVRSSQLVIDIGTAYGFTSAQMDTFFTTAATL